MQKKDMTGLTVGRLYVNEECGRTKEGGTLWRCTCTGSCTGSCGNEVIVSGKDLRQGRVLSCGCYKLQRISETHRKHGLSAEHRKLYRSIRNHFKNIRNGVKGYDRWVLDERYSNNVDGAVRFCLDLIALQPRMCEIYETDDLVIDKDGDPYGIFRPESVKFVTLAENNNNRCDTTRLIDGTSFSTFCRRVGFTTCENGNPSKAYNRFKQWFRKHNGEAHPELVESANKTILEMRQCLELLRLLDDVRAFKSQYLNH